jgi:hypothetical protein
MKAVILLAALLLVAAHAEPLSHGVEHWAMCSDDLDCAARHGEEE